MTPEGKCPSCQTAIPGRWAAKFEGQIADHPFLPRRKLTFGYNPQLGCDDGKRPSFSRCCVLPLPARLATSSRGGWRRISSRAPKLSRRRSCSGCAPELSPTRITLLRNIWCCAGTAGLPARPLPALLTSSAAVLGRGDHAARGGCPARLGCRHRRHFAVHQCAGRAARTAGIDRHPQKRKFCRR